MRARRSNLPCGSCSRRRRSWARDELVPIGFAHLDACFYAGEAHVDFARFMLDNGAKFAVPTWTNANARQCRRSGFAAMREIAGNRQGRASIARRSTRRWAPSRPGPVRPITCPGGRAFGDHIVAGESNAVTFYNSVIGARTNKYGDYLDVACAIIGKAPFAGLHTDEGRKAALLFRIATIYPDA